MARFYQIKRFLRVRAKLISLALLLTLLVNSLFFDGFQLSTFTEHISKDGHDGEENNDLGIFYDVGPPIMNMTDTIAHIMGNTLYPRSSCQMTIRNFESRYLPLRNSTKKYFLAANLRNNQEVLPSIMEQVVRLILFLGTEKVDVSISENDSKDLTRPLLIAFEKQLRDLGIKSFFDLSTKPSEYKKRNRIEILAELRNEALGPFYKNMTHYDEIIFINDGNDRCILTIFNFVIYLSLIVFFCADDVLELLHQHSFQKAHMTCGMDFHNDQFHYYDKWVGRSMTGNMLINSPTAKMFSYDEEDQKRFYESKPVQVSQRLHVFLNFNFIYSFRYFHAGTGCQFLTLDHLEKAFDFESRI